ncbi:MAG TPA: CoA pyrophosphatase [Syntrophorhabdales bacterium]|nr:CoA pyrophosphatase [Syntrophorhabdales bacterium]
MLLSRITDKLRSYRARELECVTDVRASVMVPLFVKENRLHILLTKRADRMKVHAGEISFPGGMYEETDADTKKTALRECCEEIGVKTGDVNIIGRLDDLTTLTGFVITPYVGVIPYPYAFKINQKEVAYLVYLPFEHLESSGLVQEKIEYRGRAETIDCFYYNGERIWGATCRMLMTLKRIVQDA